jgi:DNA repair exonuclease SbcCD nuclease subunit
MKIQIASDLHLEFLQKRFPDYRAVRHTDADVLVIAGDIHHKTQAIAAFSDWPVPVIYVHGNHEFYGATYEGIAQDLRTASAGSNVHYLERDELLMNGVRFLGCCLWTDYEIAGGDKDSAKQEADTCLMDYRMIRTAGGDPFSADLAEHIHIGSQAWLKRKLAEPFDGKTVVVSHHAPHPESIHPRFAGSLLNAAFVSDLSPLLKEADCWIHGHVHDSFDYRIGRARVIANPRGYAGNREAAASPEQLVWENALFDPELVIEV